MNHEKGRELALHCLDFGCSSSTKSLISGSIMFYSKDFKRASMIPATSRYALSWANWFVTRAASPIRLFFPVLMGCNRIVVVMVIRNFQATGIQNYWIFDVSSSSSSPQLTNFWVSPTSRASLAAAMAALRCTCSSLCAKPSRLMAGSVEEMW